MKINNSLVFDALCDAIMHELNTKIVLAGSEVKDILPVIRFLNKERAGRGLEPLDFAVKPDLTMSWNHWNSGGGCMIWSHDFVEKYSIHVNEECVILADLTTDEACDLEGHEIIYFLDEEPNFALRLCPYLGQELADLVTKDIEAIIAVI